MEYLEQMHYPYEELVNTGHQIIYTKDFDANNVDTHFNAIINILKDGIETDQVQNMMITVVFCNKTVIDLSIFDYCINLMFWGLFAKVNQPILDIHLVWFENITKKAIKEYIDNNFIEQYRKSLPFMQLNQTIDSVIGKFRELRPFQMYLANTLNLEDTIDLMNQYPEFNETVHFDTTGIPLEDVKEAGMQAANTQIKYIKNSNHCLRDSFRTGEAISPKQYKEVAVNIGTKPTGLGDVYPTTINHSFMNGGLSNPVELAIESSVGRVAQILQKTNVGESGSFARQLGLNNQDTFFHPDPTYICDTVNFIKVTFENESIINAYDKRYYREKPKGVDKLLLAKYADKKSLLGKTVYFRSPMTCASAARGEGICYKCYGDLAYVNRDINPGQIAAEALSSRFTQILLSAKHLLESLVIKMEWSQGFNDIFDIQFNSFALKENMDYKGFRLIINEDIQLLDELDDIDHNYYITNFLVQCPDGTQVPIHTSNADNMYFDKEFFDYLTSLFPINNNSEDSYYAELDMHKLKNFSILFVIEIKNNELSATMNKVEKLIDNKTVIAEYDKDSLIREFIATNIQGNIILDAVHYEVLLMNQMRSDDDELEYPDCTIPNENYQILTLSRSLSNNPSISVRLQSNKVNRILNSTQNRFLCKPSTTDIFYMEQPQEYISSSLISGN